MTEFNKEKVELFLGVVRKYMQMRGIGSQKDLAGLTEIGISTMSRFLNQKTADLNPQMIAKITAKLNIPLHEMIDFVEEEFADKFIRLVKFYKEEEASKNPESAPQHSEQKESQPKSSGEDMVDAFNERLSPAGSMGGTAQQKETTAFIRGSQGSQGVRMPFGAENGQDVSVREKLDRLTPRQKAYMAEFLNLDVDGRDLIVDLGNSLFHYFRQKGMNF